MKQTNNAIKFLMAQYRAIFKNAYFKGMASAMLLTAGLAIAGGAQAAQLTDATKLANAEEAITITGSSSDAGNSGKWESIKLNISASQEWNTDVTISSGDAARAGNLIYATGTADVSLSGSGSLTISTDVTKGLLVESRTDTKTFSIDLNSINVESGLLDIKDNGGGTSGAASIAANTITVGDSAARDGSATAILKLTSSAATQGIGLTLGREANTDTGAVASEIIVNEGGVVLLAAGDDTKNSISVLGKSLAVNEGGLLVQTGSSGSNIINTDVLNVAGGQVVSGAAVINSHQSTLTGDLLVESGYLDIAPESTVVDGITEVGTYTFESGSETQIDANAYIKISKGNVTVKDGAVIIATTNASDDGGYISVRNTAEFSGDYNALAKDSAKLTISSTTLTLVAEKFDDSL